MQVCPLAPALTVAASKGMAEDKLLTDKQRARLKSIREMLAAGYNPYSHVSPEDQGGLDRDRAARKAEARVIEILESRVQELERKWKSGEGPDILTVGITIDDMPSLLSRESEKDPDKLYCNFCKSEVSHSRATVGKTLKTYMGTEEVFIDGFRVVRDKLIHRTIETVACPNCCLKVKGKLAFVSLEEV